MASTRKTLIDILESQAFDRLEPFKRPTIWKSFREEERLLLAQLLVMQGARQLAEEDHQALDTFDAAAQISSNAPEILFQQGVILSSYRNNIRCLTLACQTLARALQQNPLLIKAWYLRAQVLTDIGLFEAEASYFTEAHQNFERAHAYLDRPEETIRCEEFYWKWGLCLASLGRVSGEPLDFYNSIKKFRHACQLGCQEAKFFNDFGHSLASLGYLLDRSECFAEALVCFNKAVRQDPCGFDGWYNQACCIQSLAEYKNYEKLLEQASLSFVKAAEIDPQQGQVWFKWAELEASMGKLKRDQQKLEASLLKFAKAYELESGHPQILSSWAEAELFLGAQEERLDLLQSAHVKIVSSLEIQAEDPEIWYLYGSCLNELGHYFSDEGYYHQAIEKFQYGLSLSRQNPLLWYGMALAHFALGELKEEQASFEKAVRYCSRVIECGGEGFAQFWNDWGVALLKLAEMTQEVSYVEMAIEKFERALKSPTQHREKEDIDLEWVYNYGCALDLLGDLKEEAAHFEKAIQALAQVLQLDPHYHLARYNLALALSHLGEAISDVECYYKAIEHFQVLLEQDPEDDIVHLDLGMSLTDLALMMRDVHHPERSQLLYHHAENHLMQAVSLGNAQASYQLAGLYSIIGNYEQSMHYLERAQFSAVLPGIEDLMHDDWLEGLRQTEAFRQFISELSSRQSMDDK